MDICSISGVKEPSSSMTRLLSSTYRSIRGWMKTPWGQSRLASKVGMAERTP